MAKVLRKEGNPQARRNNGIRKWRSELDRFGSSVIPMIPNELYEAVMGTEIRASTKLIRDLLKVAPERNGVNPYRVLENMLRRKP